MIVKTEAPGRASVYASQDDVHYRRTPVAQVFKSLSGPNTSRWGYALTGGGNGGGNGGGYFGTRKDAAEAAMAAHYATYAPTAAYGYHSGTRSDVLAYGETPGIAFVKAEAVLDRDVAQQKRDQEYCRANGLPVRPIVRPTIRTEPAERLECGCWPLGMRSGRRCYVCDFEFLMST